MPAIFQNRASYVAAAIRRNKDRGMIIRMATNLMEPTLTAEDRRYCDGMFSLSTKA